MEKVINFIIGSLCVGLVIGLVALSVEFYVEAAKIAVALFITIIVLMFASFLTWLGAEIRNLF